MERIKVYEELRERIYFSGTVDDAIVMLSQLKTEFEKSVYINLEIESGYAYGDSYYRVVGTRYETDEEYAERLQQQKIIDIREESDARQLYERLKQKFEPTT